MIECNWLLVCVFDIQFIHSFVCWFSGSIQFGLVWLLLGVVSKKTNHETRKKKDFFHQFFISSIIIILFFWSIDDFHFISRSCCQQAYYYFILILQLIRIKERKNRKNWIKWMFCRRVYVKEWKKIDSSMFFSSTYLRHW